MQIHPAHGLALAVATTAAPASFVSLQYVFVRRFLLRMQDRLHTARADHNWQQRSDNVQRALEIEVEAAFGNDTAHHIVRDAALNDTGFMLRITFPDGQQIVGLAGMSQYEIYAEEGDVLRSSFVVHSRGALGITDAA